MIRFIALIIVVLVLVSIFNIDGKTIQQNIDQRGVKGFAERIWQGKSADHTSTKNDEPGVDLTIKK
jgi:hypothetical protein